MSGIAGIWNLDGRPVEKTVLSRMSATLAHRGPDGDGTWIQASVGLACQLHRVTPESANETQPLVDESGTVIVFDGRLDNREELLDRLKGTRDIPRDASDPALVLAAYHAAGERVAEWLAGDFALALFDPGSQRLVLARDAIGIRPLYYTRVRETFIFASEVKAILAHPDVLARPNDDLLADFLLVRVYDPAQTLFSGVSSLPPAHTVLLTRSGLTTRQYWDFDPDASIRLGSFEDYARAFRHLFEQAVRRRLRSAHPVAVSVSGGLDSSAIFCLAQSLAQRGLTPAPVIKGFSKTPAAGSPASEQEFLRAIEEAYRVSVHRIPIGPAEFVDGSRRVVWHVEAPFLDEQWTSSDRLHRAIRESGARVLLTGHWGDQVLCQLGYLVDLFRGLRWNTVRAHLKEVPNWMTDVDPAWLRDTFVRDVVKFNVPTPAFLLLRWLDYRYRRNRPWYAKTFRDRVLRGQWRRTPLGRQFRMIHARSFYEDIRTGFQVLCMEWNNKIAAMYGMDTAFPFLDREVLAFLLAIPGEMSTHDGVLKALLREGLRDVLPESIAERRWKADFTHLVNEGTVKEYGRLIQYLESGNRIAQRGYTDDAALKSHLGALKHGLSASSAESAWALADLLGLEQWLELFMENGTGTAKASSVGPGMA